MERLKERLKEMWKINIEHQWETTIMEIQRIHRDPYKFWRKVKLLMGSNTSKIKYVKKR